MKLLIGLVLLLLLLVGVDRVAEEVAEDRIAQQLTADLASEPTVEVGGFPFLTQALRGRYGSIQVSGDTTQQGVRVAGFDADLEGARVPLRDALGGRVAAVPVDRLDGRALLTYADFAAATRVPGLQLAPAGDKVRVTGPVSVLGQDLTLSAVSAVSLEGSDVVLTAESFEVGGQEVPEAVTAAVSGRLDVRVPVSDLPYGLQLTEVRTSDEGLLLGGTARDVVLRRR